MATIRRRGKKFQVQIRRTGTIPITKTFSLYADAKAWARETEQALERGWRGGSQLTKAPLKDLLQKYKDEVTAHKRGRATEERRIDRLMRDPVSRVSIQNLSPQIIAEFRDRRSKDGKRACLYDLVIIRHAIEISRKEWGVVLHANPVDQVRKPNQGSPRERRISPQEYEMLASAVKNTRVDYLWPLINLAIETGMRRGELLALRWEHIDFEAGTAFLPWTKNGQSRLVPLGCKALELLAGQSNSHERVFPITDVAVRQAWDRLVRRAGIENLNFHDLRHEAISRFFEMGLSVAEVALISGHKDYRMLARYTHLRADNIVSKLEMAPGRNVFRADK